MFYTDVDNDGEFLHNFGKGDGWSLGAYLPDLYVNKEHVINNNIKEYRKDKSKGKKEFWKWFTKIKITIEKSN